MIRAFPADRLLVQVHANRLDLGEAAARMVGEKIAELFSTQDTVNMVFASAPSQAEFLDQLTKMKNLDWSRVNAFHMDEYLGCNELAFPGFGYFLKRSIFDRLPFRTVNYLNGLVADPEKECKRYARLILDHPTDLVCLGIGENGHLAFNDPHVADFSDEQMVKTVTLDEASRNQQVHDGCFAKLNQVPTQAITLTIPALTMGRFLYCLVPAKSKAKAVRDTLYQPVEEKYPSTILRKHPNCVYSSTRKAERGSKKNNGH